MQVQASTLPMTKLTGDAINLLKDRVNSLDLEPIKYKLMEEEDGENWSLEKCDAIEPVYKGMLVLAGVYQDIPGVSIAPCKVVDIFWHYHVLDTQKYPEDCFNALGFFLHHFPYAGLRGDADKEHLLGEFNRTRLLYCEIVGFDPVERLGRFGAKATLCMSCFTTSAFHTDPPQARPRPVRA
jgi:hypothetical protein